MTTPRQHREKLFQNYLIDKELRQDKIENAILEKEEAIRQEKLLKIRNKGKYPWTLNLKSKTSSEGETFIENWLRAHKLEFSREYTFQDCRDINLLRFDFAVISNHEVDLLIEFHGEQHYKPVKWNSRMTLMEAQNKFVTNQCHDKIKQNYCLSKNLPLIIIPYWDKDKISDILSERLYSASVSY